MRTDERPVRIKAQTPKRARPKSRVFTFDDPLFKLLGSARSDGAGDVSTNKSKYLAKIYAADQ
jgi:hypothetical protein